MRASPASQESQRVRWMKPGAEAVLRGKVDEVRAQGVRGETMLAELAWTPDQVARRERAENGEAVVANISRDLTLVAWAQAAGRFHYVGRAVPRKGWTASRWANPFRVEDSPGSTADERRRAAVASYVEHLDHHPELLERVERLRGAVLGCWCAPAACHADELAARANRAARGGTR